MLKWIGLEEMLRSGMESPASEWTPADVERLKSAARDRAVRKRERG
jgi:hypothetical protein